MVKICKTSEIRSGWHDCIIFFLFYNIFTIFFHCLLHQLIYLSDCGFAMIWSGFRSVSPHEQSQYTEKQLGSK